MIDEVAAKLKERLNGPLPGIAAHGRMTSYKRPDAREAMRTVPNPRFGSVLIPIYVHNDELHTSLMMRPKYNGVHSAQVSFPGGSREGDETPELTALRESHEELGIFPDHVQILGKLTEVFIPPSRFLVTPFVGVLPQRPVFRIDRHEVEQLIEVPLKTLFDDRIESEQEIELPQNRGVIFAPCFAIEEYVIWGATAMIISEFKILAKNL